MHIDILLNSNMLTIKQSDNDQSSNSEPSSPSLELIREPLFEENPNRFVMFPIQYPDIWAEYKKQVACFWTPEEIDFVQDRKDWATLNSNEQHFIKMVLAFFAASDGIVLENLASRFMGEIQIPEARAFYGFQIMMESFHGESYSLLIDTYITDSKEKKKLFEAVDNYPCVAAKANWALRWIGSEATFAERLVAFACVEGIFFSGSFCAIYWIKKRGKMPGLTFSNELISRDEGLHTQFACLLYKNHIVNKLTNAEAHRLVKTAVNIEKEFICEALPVSLIGMNATLMSQYIEYVADYLLVDLGHPKIFNVANPFDFMDLISLRGKTNFFEKRVGEYQKAGVMAALHGEKQFEFTTEADF